MDKVRFIMIGLGGMGRVHVQHVLNLPNAEIVALADSSPASLQATVQRFPDLANVAQFSDYQAALDAVEADAAIIVTPHSQHFQQSIDCLDAGLNVLLEKPFIAGSGPAQAVIDHAEQRNRRIAVSYQRHTQPEFMYLRQLVQSGALGDITFVTAYLAQSWLQGTKGTWRQDPALSCGGQLNDSGSHVLDVLLWVSGLVPAEITAYIENRGSAVDIDSALSIRFVGGAVGTVNIVGSSALGWWEDFTLHGTTGTALYRNGQLSIQRSGEDPVLVNQDDLPAGSNPAADFVDVLLGKKAEAAAPASSGYAVSRLTEAAWRSAAEGRSITFQ